jgi:hypothetical protein
MLIVTDLLSISHDTSLHIYLTLEGGHSDHFRVISAMCQKRQQASKAELARTAASGGKPDILSAGW